MSVKVTCWVSDGVHGWVIGMDGWVIGVHGW